MGKHPTKNAIGVANFCIRRADAGLVQTENPVDVLAAVKLAGKGASVLIELRTEAFRDLCRCNCRRLRVFRHGPGKVRPSHCLHRMWHLAARSIGVASRQSQSRWSAVQRTRLDLSLIIHSTE